MKYIKFIRIFLLVLIVIGIGLLLTQKMWVPRVVDMIMFKGWKTFRDSTYGFEFKYPNDWNLDGNSIYSDPVYGGGGVTLTKEYNCKAEVWLGDTQFDYESYREGWADNSVIASSSITVAGISGFNVTGTENSLNDGIYLQYSDTKDLRISLYTRDSSCMPVYYQILSSFKFVK